MSKEIAMARHERPFPSAPSRAATALVAIALSASAPATAAAVAADSSLASQIDVFLRGVYPADEPGAAVIALKDGKPVFRGAYGMADLELGVPLAPDMVFELGSITKQFTGAAILLLESEGKLSVDDPITKFLPNYPTHGHHITVAHLLDHSSGIRSYTDIPGWMQTKIRQDMTLDELVAGFENEPMDFAPGERFQYNNSGYVLLGAIVEKASGMKYADFIEQRIFAPLGMTASYYGDSTRIIPRRAHGYDGGPGRFTNAQFLSMTQPHAAGSLMSTVDDLAKWDASLYTNDLLDEPSRKKQITPFSLNDGSSTNYAYGLFISELRGHPMISHSGGIFGFTTFAARLPADRVYVAVLTNGTGRPASPSFVGRKVAAMVIGDPFPDLEAIELAAEKLAPYTGVYRIDEQNTRNVMLIDGKLYTQRTDGQRQGIEPYSANGFFYPGSFSTLTFERDGAGKVTHMLFYADGAKTPERAQRTDEPLPAGPEAVAVDPSIYDRYVGVYELAPGFEIVVTREGDRLLAQPTGQPAAELFPTSPTEYFLKVVDARVRFEVDSAGRATALELDQSGRKLRGERRDGG